MTENTPDENQNTPVEEVNTPDEQVNDNAVNAEQAETQNEKEEKDNKEQACDETCKGERKVEPSLPKREPRVYKKELSIDFALYELEKNQALQQGFTTGFNRAFQAFIQYLKEEKTFAEQLGKGEANPLWEHLLNALGKGDEWTEYLINKNKK